MQNSEGSPAIGRKIRVYCAIFLVWNFVCAIFLRFFHLCCWDLIRFTEISRDLLGLWKSPRNSQDLLIRPYIGHFYLWHLTFGVWHLTFDICHLTFDIWHITWHITLKWHWHIPKSISFMDSVVTLAIWKSLVSQSLTILI